MEEKKLLKISVSSVIFTIVVIIVVSIIATAYTFSRFYNAHIAEQTKIIKLNEAISRLENRNNDVIADITNSNIYNQKQVITEQKKQEIFKKLNGFEGDFLNTMIDEKDYNKAKFSDYEMVRLLPKLELDKFKKSFIENGSYVGSVATASINVIQSLANKYFHKTITLDNINTKASIVFNSDDTISIGIGEGYAKYKYDLISIDSIDQDKYDVTFKCTKDDNTINQYILNIKYTDTEINFLSLKRQ